MDGIDASCRFEADLVVCFLIVLLDSFAHHISGFRGSGRLLFSGRCLDEIRTRLHG